MGSHNGEVRSQLLMLACGILQTWSGLMPERAQPTSLFLAHRALALLAQDICTCYSSTLKVSMVLLGPCLSQGRVQEVSALT